MHLDLAIRSALFAAAAALVGTACSSDDETNNGGAPQSTAGKSHSAGSSSTQAGAGQGGTGTGGSSGAGGASGAAGSASACKDTAKDCDPFHPTEGVCAEDQSCRATEAGTTECACPAEFPGPQNAPCSNPGECQSDFVCVRGTCRTLCDPSETPTTCEGGLPCKALGTSKTLGACDS